MYGRKSPCKCPARHLVIIHILPTSIVSYALSNLLHALTRPHGMDRRGYPAVMKSLFLLLLGTGVTITAQNNCFPDCTTSKLAENDVCNTALPPSERAAALVAVLTDDEKLQNLVS